MKQVRVIAIVLSLLIGSFVSVKTASAGGIYPYSEGCTWQVSGSGQSTFTKYFYDHDIIHVNGNVSVNVIITGYNVNYQNTYTSVNFDIPATGTYTVNIMPIGANPYWVYSCTPTPISGICIVSNAYFTSGITIGAGTFNAGERIKFVADNYMTVSITGTVTSTTYFTKNFTYYIPTTGSYTFTVSQAARGTLNGTVTCTLPR